MRAGSRFLQRTRKSHWWSAALFGPKIDQDAASYDGYDAQNRRNWQRMVFCSVDLDCTHIYGFLLARIGESPVDKRCNPRNDNSIPAIFIIAPVLSRPPLVREHTLTSAMLYRKR